MIAGGAAIALLGLAGCGGASDNQSGPVFEECMRRPAESIALIRQAAPDSEAAEAYEAGIRDICGRMVDCVAAGTGESDQPLLDAAGSGVMDRCYRAASSEGEVFGKQFVEKYMPS
jgi:hypothetical protein